MGGLNPAGVTLINPDSTLTSALDDTHGVLYANGALFTLFNAKTAHVYDRIKKHEASVIDCPTCGKYDTDLRRRLLRLKAALLAKITSGANITASMIKSTQIRTLRPLLII